MRDKSTDYEVLALAENNVLIMACFWNIAAMLHAAMCGGMTTYIMV